MKERPMTMIQLLETIDKMSKTAETIPDYESRVIARQMIHVFELAVLDEIDREAEAAARA